MALEDSSSMADNISRSIALLSLNTISSALALLEVGQLGILRWVIPAVYYVDMVWCFFFFDAEG